MFIIIVISVQSNYKSKTINQRNNCYKKLSLFIFEEVVGCRTTTRFLAIITDQ